MDPKPKKRRMGRKKIPIEKIQHLNYRQVTFSKRRAGLFKKASELCILCGAEIAIVVFSPAGKAFSFGHPSVDSVLDRFLSKQTCRSSSSTTSLALVTTGAREHQQKQYMEVMAQLEVEKKRGEAIERTKKVEMQSEGFWWEETNEGLGLEELEQRKVALQKMRDEVARRVREMVLRGCSASGFLDDDAAVDQFVHQETTPSCDLVPYDFGF